jgi:hypothetical protein
MEITRQFQLTLRYDSDDEIQLTESDIIEPDTHVNDFLSYLREGLPDLEYDFKEIEQ